MKKKLLPFIVSFLIALNIFILYENKLHNASENIDISVYSDEDINEWSAN